MIRVGVIRGGVSSEYEVSLETGKSVLSVLHDNFKDIYTPVDILITKDGTWHFAGREIRPEQLVDKIDVAFIALHGSYGEDGQIQQIFEDLGIPYVGSKPEPSKKALNKWSTKEYAREIDVLVSKDIYLDQYTESTAIPYADYVAAMTRETMMKLSPPWVVKPVESGSSIGISIVKTATDLQDVLMKLLGESVVLVEEYIEGREATVAVTDNLRNEDIYAFLPIEIRTKSTFFDFDAKYSGEAEEISPGNFSQTEKQVLMDYAKRIHKGLGLRHYSRSDFIVGKNGKIYFLEVNNLPGLTKESLVPKSLPPVGVTLPEFIHHLIGLALK
jgi:D-alanine-D-alanine ligase